MLSLRVLGRKTKIELLNDAEDVCKILFTTARTQLACRLFLDYLKEKKAVSRKELSSFAWDLQKGKIKEGFHYSRTQFYAQVRKVLLTFGLISLQERFDEKREFDLHFNIVRQKYAAVRQPITKRPPDGLNLPRITWEICNKWNEEFVNWNERVIC